MAKFLYRKKAYDIDPVKGDYFLFRLIRDSQGEKISQVMIDVLPSWLDAINALIENSNLHKTKTESGREHRVPTR